ncbi:MAG: hypothetical protein ACLSWI_00520 [Candidatus Gastranaerophilaceae bacterium]
MKRTLLLLIVFLIPVKAFAYRDYVLFSDSPVKSVTVEDKSVLEAFPVQTIDNSKKTIILKSKKEGKTNIILITDNGKSYIEAVVKKDETDVKKIKGFDVKPFDFPPENLKIDGIDILLPPKKLGGE